jgi:phage terminase small subunit
MPTPTKSNENKALTGAKSKPGLDLTAGTPTKPSGLSAGASQEWDRLITELAAAGLQITAAHRAPLTLAATIAADIKADWAVIQAEGAYQTNRKTGAVQAHPAVKRMDALRRDYIKVLALLGLRAAVSGEKAGEPDELDAILNG